MRLGRAATSGCRKLWAAAVRFLITMAMAGWTCSWSTAKAGAAKKAPGKLYRNLGNGTFADVTERAGLDFSVYGMGATIADYDADGDPDIYLTTLGPNLLLRNDAGRFVDVAQDSGRGRCGLAGRCGQ